MSAKEIQELIDLYLQAKCSTAQKETIARWFEKYEATSRNFYNGDEALIQASMERSLSALNEKISATGEKSQQKVKKLWLKKLSVAALLLISVSAALFFYKRDQSTSVNFYVNDIPPGKNKAVLTLADGSLIALDDAGPGQVAGQPGIKISKTTAGQLVYEITGAGRPGAKTVYNTIRTPAGGQYRVILPDKTAVWLNASSSLTFPVTFGALKERRVTLTGEGYFEVAKARRLPFIVVADKQEITVLGTHFNVSSYRDDSAVKTTLLEGSVRINENILLRPGEQAIQTQDSLIVSKTDTELAVAWKNGKFKFKNEHIKDLMRKLARWYNVEVVYDGKMTNKDFSGSISRSDKLSKILDFLQATNTVHFKIEGRRITVMP